MKIGYGVVFGIAMTMLTNMLGLYGNPGGETLAFFLPGIIFWALLFILVAKQMGRNKEN